jgi:gamma-D-glutamyl-L-lysine dipeptidyl-peptidase
MRYSFLTFILLAFILCGCSNKSLKILQKQIDEVAAEYVPDKRTGIADALVKKQGGATVLIKGETLYPDAKDKMVALVKGSGFQVIDSITVLPGHSVGDKTWGLVTVSVANIRSRPSHPAELSTQAVMGTPVRIIKKQSGWLMVQTPDNYLGWTNSSSVKTLTYEELLHWKQSDRLIFNGLNGTIYTNELNSQPVSDLVAGAILTHLSESEKYYHVALPDGRAGYADKNGFLSFSKWVAEVEATPEGISETALRFMGLPYLWGGTSSKSLDCSGFTKTVYFLNGIILERDASQQIRHGSRIAADNNFSALQNGDLLFYGSRDPFRVVHVGIWMGNTEVIHASGMVKIESMDKSRSNYSDYLNDTFLGEVRRIIGFPSGEGIVSVREHSWY